MAGLMSRPDIALRNPSDIEGGIVLIDRDGKETPISRVELLMLLGKAALVAQLIEPDMPANAVTPFRRPSDS